MSRSRKPTRNFDSLSITHDPPGARKEKLREIAVPESTSYDHLPHVHEKFGGTLEESAPLKTPTALHGDVGSGIVDGALRTPDSGAARSTRDRRQLPPRPYAELRAASAFSFLDGATLPEDLVEVAASCGFPAMALVDRNGVYGAPRFYSAAKKAGLRPLVGAELVLEKPAGQTHLTLLVENRTGYRNLCRLITAGAMGKEKGAASYTWERIEQHAEGLHCLTGGDEGPIARALRKHDEPTAR
jgi:hypothetical protein